jgi:hypothetical protein
MVISFPMIVLTSQLVIAVADNVQNSILNENAASTARLRSIPTPV